MNQHVIEHGRMFNAIDDEKRLERLCHRHEHRDQLFGAPEDVGREIIPIGEYISINAVPFRIIGMFQRYESEQDRKKRELEKDKPKEKTTGVARSRGWGGRGGRGGGGFVFGWKNNTIYIPLNTMWIKFRSAGGGGHLTRFPTRGFPC
jgi:putative ABC transport system permease protein